MFNEKRRQLSLLLEINSLLQFFESLENYLSLNEIIRNFDIFSEEENRIVSVIVVKIIGFIIILLQINLLQNIHVFCNLCYHRLD